MDYTIYKTKNDMRPGKENEICYCEEEQKAYIWKNKRWESYKPNSTINLNSTIYELNKQVIVQLSSKKTKEQLAPYKKIIREMIKEDTKYFMLLCNDIHYYTVFVIDNGEEKFEDVVIECLQDWGEIKAIYNETGYVECWVADKEECRAFMLFNYDGGVVKCQ